MNDGLIYDWNAKQTREKPSKIILLDETLRDGLQSPSVKAPTIDQKLRILHLLDRIGIDTADIGLPGAGPHIVHDAERHAREIVASKLMITAQCAAGPAGGGVCEELPPGLAPLRDRSRREPPLREARIHVDDEARALREGCNRGARPRIRTRHDVVDSPIGERAGEGECLCVSLRGERRFRRLARGFAVADPEHALHRVHSPRSVCAPRPTR